MLNLPLDLALAAYMAGKVPYGLGTEVIWRAPHPRYYLDLQHARFPRDVQRRSMGRGWEVRVNEDFAGVVDSCATVPRNDESAWLTSPLRTLYADLHTAGLACSIEVWRGSELIAGEFGVLLGGAFICESKFHLESDSGNLCTGAAVLTLAEAGFTVYDAQFGPKYLARFSHHGLEAFGERPLSAVMEQAAEHRFRRFSAGLRSGLVAPELPWLNPLRDRIGNG